MLTPFDIKNLLEEKDLKVLKSLGQNFLIDEMVLSEIVSAADLGAEDVVLEVGPGLGTLTAELAKKCKAVIAVEKDKKMAEMLLKNKLTSGLRNAEILEGDILRMNIADLIKEHDSSGKYKLVSNIPYYITSPIIKLFLETPLQPKMIVLLVQKEVAQRICAPKGKLSVLALSVLLYGKPEIVGYVPRTAFFPVPKVDSAILKITDIEKKHSDEYYQKIFRIIKMGFSAKRKKLVNNISGGLQIEKEEAENMLLKLQISPDVRAQELGLEEWEKLAEITR